MTPLSILDLIAGMIFIFFLLSVVNNSFVEGLNALSRARARMLKEWIVKTFKSDGNVLANSIMNHPLLNGLSKKNESTQYMEGKGFARVLVGILLQKLADTRVRYPNTDNIESVISDSGLPLAIQGLLKNFIARTRAQKLLDQSLNEVEHVEKQVEEWFDSMMKRLTGRFKKSTMRITVIFSSFLVTALNVDSLQLTKYLYDNPQARMEFAEASYAAANDTIYKSKVNHIKKRLQSAAQADSTQQDDTVYQSLDSLVADLKTTRTEMEVTVATVNSLVPLGWTSLEWDRVTHPGDNILFLLKKFGGFLITILAICLGAPFWFDVLGKVANLRSSLKPQVEEKPKNN